MKALLAMGRKADFHDQNDIACFPRCYVLVKLRFGKKIYLVVDLYHVVRPTIVAFVLNMYKFFLVIIP